MNKIIQAIAADPNIAQEFRAALSVGHTPWQWYWREEEGRADCGVFYERRPGQAVSVCRAPQFEKRETWKKHARLIAAAPTMLDALQKCHEWLQGSEPGRAQYIGEVIRKATT